MRTGDHLSVQRKGRLSSIPDAHCAPRYSTTSTLKYTPCDPKRTTARSRACVAAITGTTHALLEVGEPDLLHEAARIRDRHHSVVTFSPKVFIPLTRLCRNFCGYCTFAQPPRPGIRAYMTMEEMLDIAELGRQHGCSEALFTLGDKPELIYPEAQAELEGMGYSCTLEYVRAAAAEVMRVTGLVPHINAGVMDEFWMRRLKEVSGSQGLMLESSSSALMAPGQAHDNCPDKDPTLRMKVLEEAGKAKVPFTTGILIGIGESREDRLRALEDIRKVHLKYGHIQEVIIQNFRAKPGTAMWFYPEPTLKDLTWTVAAARIILGGEISIQAPPNLTPAEGPGSSPEALEESWIALLDAGINDLGGISPITKDYVNPEKAWPHLSALAAATASRGKHLVPRLPVYPKFAMAPQGTWLSEKRLGGPGALSVGGLVRSSSDSSGWLRASQWCPGMVLDHEIGVPLGPGQPSQGYSSSSSAAGDIVGTSSVAQCTGSSTEESLPSSPSLSATPPSAPPSGLGLPLSGHPDPPGPNPLRPSIPTPRPRLARSWRVSMTREGTLEGTGADDMCPPSDDVVLILDKVMTEVRQQYPQNEERPAVSTVVSALVSVPSAVNKVLPELSEEEMVRLLQARGADFKAVCNAANELRRLVKGDAVSYVVNRNINYTNVCTYKCAFCAFSKGKSSEELRGAPYVVDLEEITRRTAEAWARGATEVCMQGGIHPDFTGATYLRILAAAKDGAPDIHVHAFSPLEVQQGAFTLGVSITDFLRQLRSEGLGSLPGTAAEVLDDKVRAVLCPDKLSTQEWLEVVEAAHDQGIRTTSTIMFGHLDDVHSWAVHLAHLRALQKKTGGFTEFVPLPFVHMVAPIYLRGLARRGPTLRECILMHAVARLALHPYITNIQASWVKMGPHLAADLLRSGCNDMGGSIMNESITRAAGAQHGQELPPERMEALIRGEGRIPRQRTTLYGEVPTKQWQRSFGADSLLEVTWSPPNLVL